MSREWWQQEKRSARKLRAMAVVDYALARRYIDQAQHRELREAIPPTPHLTVPELVGHLPVPRWDRVPVDQPVDRQEQDFAVALLDVAHQAEALNAADRKWRKVFARNARTAGDLLVLFVDIERYLSRRREDPKLATRLARLAFVSEILQARSKNRISRPEFDRFLERTASGESLDTLRAELGVPAKPRPWVAKPVLPEPVVVKPAAAEPRAAEPEAAKAKAPDLDRPVTDIDRARIAKYLERALTEERLEPGEHAARTVALWSATTRQELARLVVDLPVPVDEPLRDRKPDHRSDDLILPADRQAAIDRLNHAMTGHALTLLEYETRLDVALKARTYEELWPATADLR